LDSENCSCPFLQKPVQTRFLAQKGVAFLRNALLQKNFLVPGRDSGGGTSASTYGSAAIGRGSGPPTLRHARAARHVLSCSKHGSGDAGPLVPTEMEELMLVVTLDDQRGEKVNGMPPSHFTFTV
jgi:hypothetical protein